MRRLLALLLTGLVLVGGCRADLTRRAAEATQLIDEGFSAEYAKVADACLESAKTRSEYDECISRWDAVADSVRALRQAALALDVTKGRKSWNHAACRWYEALSVFSNLSPVPIPAAEAALDFPWRRRC